MPKETEKIIGSIPLFRGLTEEQVLGLAKIAVRKRYAREEMIFSEGDPGSGLYVCIAGRVKIFKLSSEGKEQILHIIERGEPFAEVAMFAGTRFPAHAEAMTDAEALFFPRAAFMELVKSDPSLSMNMLAVLSQRLKQFARLVENLSLKEVPQRLAAFLLYLSGRQQATAIVDIGVTKGQLASLLGTIPETLSRILSRMVSQGLIRVQGRQVTLVDRESLQALASGDKTAV